MNITATLFNYYFVCHRKLWLHAHEIRMEHTSDVVYEGKMLHETAYPQRAEKGRELELSVPFGEDALSIKIDFYDTIRKVVHEIKKSNKIEAAHEAQVKFYVFVLELSGIEGVRGAIEYPTLRKTTAIELCEDDRTWLKETIEKIKHVIELERCPERIKKSFCETCSYFEFCWIEED